MKKSILAFILIVIIVVSAILIYASETNITAYVNVIGEMPFITIHSPIDGEIYNTKFILVNITLKEKVKDLYYQINSRTWGKLCSGCSGYAEVRRFYEGQNNLTIEAVTYNDTQYFSSITFYIDTIRPRIHSTYPLKTGNGTFGVRYTEVNLEEITLQYGKNTSDIHEKVFENCVSGTNIWCYNYVNISEYNGQYIYYRFLVQDKFYSTFSSWKKILVNPTSISGISGMAVSESAGFLSGIFSFFKEVLRI